MLNLIITKTLWLFPGIFIVVIVFRRCCCCCYLNPLSTNFTKWSNTLKQFVVNAKELLECVWPFCGIGA